MSVDDMCEFYCLNYNNLNRKISMTERFEKLNIKCNLYEGVDHDNEKIKILNEKYGSSIYCMYGHINMIYDFYHNTNKPYGIFCEDDIVIHKDFKDKLDDIIKDFENLNLDVLLLGYLTTTNISHYYHHINSYPNYYQYPDDMWGTQMYMLSRDNAKVLLDRYYDGISYMNESLIFNLPPLSADWTITKQGNRALYFPLLVIEDGQNIHEHYGQHYLHHFTFVNNYIEGEYI
jgi:GR25 family glycosyltransferase involved in LPS biosynthesis